MYLPIVVGKLTFAGSHQVHTFDVPSTREEVANTLLQTNTHTHELLPCQSQQPWSNASHWQQPP